MTHRSLEVCQGAWTLATRVVTQSSHFYHELADHENRTTKQFGTASSTKMLWNPNRKQNQEQSTRKSSRRNKDETAREDVIWKGDFLTIAKFPGFHFQLTKISRRRRKLKAKVTTKSLPRSANSARVVTQSNHVYQNWRHENKLKKEAAQNVKSEGGFMHIFKWGKVAFCTKYTWLTVLRGPQKDSFVQNCLTCVYNCDEQSCLHSFVHSFWIDFLQISGVPSYKLWKIWTTSSSFQLWRKDSKWVRLICSMAHIFVQCLDGHEYFVAI